MLEMDPELLAFLDRQLVISEKHLLLDLLQLDQATSSKVGLMELIHIPLALPIPLVLQM